MIFYYTKFQTAQVQPLTVVFWDVAILLYVYISFIYGKS
jgi:hypothetical protein